MKPIVRLLLVLLAFSVSCSSAPSGPESASALLPSLPAIANAELEMIDLTYPLNDRNPYWPGPAATPFQYQTLSRLEEGVANLGAFRMPEHFGTHLDAPNHVASGQRSVDLIPLSDLVAPAVVVDVSNTTRENPDYRLSLQDLTDWEADHGQIPQGAVVLAYSGWGRFWDNYSRYKNQDDEGRLHFPGFSVEAARFLVEQRDIKGIGIDTLSVDFGVSEKFEVHQVVNGAGRYHLENLANLDQMAPLGAWLIVAPIKLEGGSGGPARVWAVSPRRPQ